MKLPSPTLLLSLLVWTACTPVSSREIALQEARARLHTQELSQHARKIRATCQEYLDLRRQERNRIKTAVSLGEQALAYKAEAKHLIRQKPPGAQERAGEISAALGPLETDFLDIAQWAFTTTERMEKLNTQLESLSLPKRPDDLPSWALSDSIWAIDQGQKTIAEAAILCGQAEQVGHASEPFRQRFFAIAERFREEPLDSLIDQLEQIAI